MFCYYRQKQKVLWLFRVIKEKEAKYLNIIIFLEVKSFSKSNLSLNE